MSHPTTKTQDNIMKRLSLTTLAIGAAVLSGAALGAIPGIQPTAGSSGAPDTIALTASAATISQPDGASVYSWGYGCTTGSAPVIKGYTGAGPAASCPLMQVPGPTLIVTEGHAVTVTLTNSLPAIAGNTSLLFPGLNVCTGTLAAGVCTPDSTDGVAGLRTREALPGGTVSYTFTATKPGTYAYYSGTQSDLQIEMGLYGAVVVVPQAIAAGCKQGTFSLSGNAYDRGDTCYDREFLFQFAEMNSLVHEQVLAQVNGCTPSSTVSCPQISANMEPYRANYFLVNGRSMPDLMDTPFAAAYPHQPYNGNPQMHPGERMLMRVIGQGRWQHPFHFHGNHARVLARDGNLLVSDPDPSKGALAGPLLFTIPTVPGQSVDAIFSWSGKGLNWDVYNHRAGDGSRCIPDAAGFHSVASDPNYGEWCADHLKPIPVTPPDPQIVANGQWYGGTPYLALSGQFNPVNLPPGTLNQNPGAGYAYMWHSHNEREITTNDVFPGGMMMMMIVEPPAFLIDETL
jgi:FtsP/CotA-like multicopper oxidase with cupredoxin domain